MRNEREDAGERVLGGGGRREGGRIRANEKIRKKKPMLQA